MIHYFFTGSKNVSAAEIEELEAFLKSPPIQKEFCDYMIHSSKTRGHDNIVTESPFRILRKTYER